MLRDIRFGLRMLARHPSVTGLATIALALGIGGSTLVFSVVYAVLLKPLPVADPDRLVWIWANSPSRDLAYAFTAYSTYAEWKPAVPPSNPCPRTHRPRRPCWSAMTRSASIFSV